jgi:hypothetical protein
MLKGNYVLGYQHDTVNLQGSPYLERWFVYIFGCTVRLHKFLRGDDDRAPHDHPWPFWTFPLTGYWESTWDEHGGKVTHFVKPRRLHYRPSRYRHMVLGSSRFRWLDFITGHPVDDWTEYRTPKPFWTIVVTGRKDRSWGFYPNGEYVYYRDFQKDPNLK